MITLHSRSSFIPGQHGFVSSHGMAISSNISINTSFLMYNFKNVSSNKKIAFDTYARFPLIPFLLIRLVTNNNIYNNLGHAIKLGSLFSIVWFIGCMYLSYSIANYLINNSLISICIMLLAYSNPVYLKYCDLIFSDIPAVFGVLGVTYFMLENKFTSVWRNPLIIIFASLISWQVLILCICVLFLNFFFRLKQTESKNLENKFFVFASSIAFITCSTSLLLNLINEIQWTSGKITNSRTLIILKGKITSTEFGELPLPWVGCLENIFQKIGSLISLGCFDKNIYGTLLLTIGIIATMFILIFSTRFKNSYVLNALLLQGIIWFCLFRRFSLAHEYQSFLLIGFPLLFYSYIFYLIKPILSNFLCYCLFPCFSILFAISSINQSQIKNKSSQACSLEVADFNNIRKHLNKNDIVYLGRDITSKCGGHHAIEFYLNDFILTSNKDLATYQITKENPKTNRSLTPNNNYYNIEIIEGV